MLARGLAAAAVIASASGAATWTEIAYPTGAAKHLVVTSPKVVSSAFPGGEVNLEYQLLYRTGDKFGAEYAAGVTTKAGTADKYAMQWAADGNSKGTEKLVSNDPDFTSLLTIDGKFFSVTHFETPRPGAAYLSELEQDDKGKLTVKATKAIDFSTDGGLWIPCAGSVTPWMTHLGSEEYEPNARAFYESTTLNVLSNHTNAWMFNNYRDFMRYFGKYEAKTDAFTKEVAIAGGFHPYRYGYPWETVVKSDFTEKTKKLYSHGRQAWELSYVMPDSRTVYGTDDGTNVFFTYFKANTAKDLSAGTNYCAKYTQTSAATSEAKDWTATIEWIAMPTATEADVKAAIETTTFADLFDTEACPTTGSTAGVCPTDGFKSVNSGGFRCECLKVKPGKEALAGTLEKRRYAGYIGCTTEFRKWEGITYDSKNKKIYTALSGVERGMEDNMKNGVADTQYDLGGSNHLKMKHNKCGCVMEMEINDDFLAIKAKMLVCGVPNVDPATKDIDSCVITGIASPDNVAMIGELDQLIIGEDTEGHVNDLVWIYDLKSGSMTRIASTPYGSETTSPYWHTLGDYSYMTFVVQHPYGETKDDKAATIAAMKTLSEQAPAMPKTNAESAAPPAKAGYVGYIGPFPRVKKTVVATSTDKAAAAPRSVSSSTFYGVMGGIMTLVAIVH